MGREVEELNPRAATESLDTVGVAMAPSLPTLGGEQEEEKLSLPPSSLMASVATLPEAYISRPSHLPGSLG